MRLALFFIAAIAAAQTCTTITDTIYSGVGSTAKWNGVISIESPSFDANGATVRTITTRVTVTSGAFSACLYPNDTGTPSTTSYRVYYQASTGKTYTRYWRVPETLSTLRIGDVEQSAELTQVSPVTLSQLTGAASNSGKFICSNGTSWVPCSALADPTTTTGDIIYRGAGGLARLGIGSSGQVLTVSGGLPVWSAAAGGGGSGTVTSVGLTMPSGFTVSNSPITGAGSIAVTTAISGIVKVAAGAFSAATAGTDYENPLTFSSPLSRSTNTVSCPTCVVTGGSYSDPSWLSMSWSAITGKPTFAAVATSGSYADLSNKPTIPGTTDALTEGSTNLYFTTARARGSVSATGAISYNSSTGEFSCTAASGSTAGCLSSADWATFNGKQAAISGAPGTWPSFGGAALLSVGTTAGTVAAGDDSRLSDARTPTAHAASHATGQSDALSGTLGVSISGNAATATALAATPTQCSSPQYSTGVAASGAANCAQVAYSQVSGTPTVPRSLIDSSIGAFTPADYTGVFGGTGSHATTSDATLGTAVYSFRQSSGGATRAALVKAVSGNWKIKVLVNVDLNGANGSHAGIYATVGTGTPTKYVYFAIVQTDGNSAHDFALYSTDGSWTIANNTTGHRNQYALYSNKGLSPRVCLHLANSSGTLTASYSMDCSDSNARIIGTRAWGDTALSYAGLGFYDSYSTTPKHIFISGISIQ